jgi:hypothetical protein
LQSSQATSREGMTKKLQVKLAWLRLRKCLEPMALMHLQMPHRVRKK